VPLSCVVGWAMTVEEVFRYIDELLEEFQREEDQAIMQRNMDKAIAGLAGKDACERLRRRLQFAADVRRNVELVTRKAK
jgi:hypothetical protein